MDLGEHVLCLDVSNLEASIDFYTKLGFALSEDHRPKRWAVVSHNNLSVCLFEGIEENLINFRGGDVEAIHREAVANGLDFEKPAKLHPDGSWNATVYDPDGNAIFFNTFPRERERYLASRKRTGAGV